MNPGSAGDFERVLADVHPVSGGISGRDGVSRPIPLAVRTNRERLVSTFQQQAVLVVGGASPVVLAALSGLGLSVDIPLSMVYGQRERSAALGALGASTWNSRGCRRPAGRASSGR